MPAVTVDDLLVLPRNALPEQETRIRSRPVRQVVTAPRQLEGSGFEVRRPFPGPVTARLGTIRVAHAAPRQFAL